MKHWGSAEPDCARWSPSGRENADIRSSWPAAPAFGADERAALAALLLFALVLRVVASLNAGFAHQDEIFQYFEAAHRVAFGQGLVPWEYRYGMRNWLLPLLLAGPMRLGEAIVPDSLIYLLLPRLLLASLSLGVVVAAWSLGRRLSPLHGQIAGAVAAAWPELVHFAPHALTEPIAIALILPAAALLDSERLRQLVAAGLLFGLAGLMRFHYLPAIGVLVLIATARRRETWLPVAMGGAAALLIGLCIDVLMAEMPFGWLFASVRENIIQGRAAQYGVAGPMAYFAVADTIWAGWAVPIVTLALIGARRRPELLAAALVNFAVHSAIAHKEYRFILLTNALLIILAGIGTAEALTWARNRFPAVRFAPFAVTLWAIAATSLAASGRPVTFDTPAGPARTLFADLHRDAALCGLATSNISFADAGGYTLLHRNVAMFAFEADEAAALAAGAHVYNRIVAPAATPVPAGFTATACSAGAPGFPRTCIYARRGGCFGSDAAHAINTVLARIDQ